MKKVLVCLMVLFLAIGLYANGAQEAADNGPIKIGSIQDLSGSASNAGQPNAWGAEYAVKVINENGGINGRQIEIYTQDCKNDVTEGLNAYHKLVDEIGVCAIIGPALSNPASAWVDLSAEDQIPIVGHFMDEICTTNPDNGETYEYMFLCEPSCSQQAQDLAEYAIADLNQSKFAILYNPSNAFAKAQVDPFIEYVKGRGCTVTDIETFGWADKDYSAQALKIVASGAECVFLGDYLGQMVIAYDALRDAGFTGVVIGANTMAPPFAHQVKNDVYDCYFLQNYDMLNPEVGNINALVTKHMEETGTTSPQVNVGFGWDAVLVLTEAMKKAKNPTDGVELASLIAQTKDLELSGGVKITINDSHRTDTMGMYIATYDENKDMKIVGYKKVD